jgi:hypothetical protein
VAQNVIKWRTSLNTNTVSGPVNNFFNTRLKGRMGLQSIKKRLMEENAMDIFSS